MSLFLRLKSRFSRAASTFLPHRREDSVSTAYSGTVGAPGAPLLEVRGVGKSFLGVRALHDVSFTIQAGEVHALVGENGAGKSTLMKIIAGSYKADEGEIFINGERAAISSPVQAIQAGIAMIYQETNLVPALGATENVTLGIEPARFCMIDNAGASQMAHAALSSLGIELPAGKPASAMSVAEQQLVEIAKALVRKARIIVMDEPTAALTDRETDRLFELIGKLKASGTGIVYISHRLEELPRIADRITVLRDGETVETRALHDMPADEMVRLMVGRTIENRFPALPAIGQDAPVVLSVKGMTCAPAVNDISLNLPAGAIYGLAGLVGAGRTEFLRLIAGADRAQKGTIAIDGKQARIRSPHDAIAAGIAFITEDRKGQGLVLGMSVRENTTLAHLERFTMGGFVINRQAEREATERFIKDLRIRTPHADQPVVNLSGGNQQKVVLAKWLVGKARVFLFDEPTRGIDIGAKSEIYELIVELAKQGAAIIIASSELPEVLGISHRILVVRDGRIAADLDRSEATPDKVMRIATGVIEQ